MTMKKEYIILIIVIAALAMYLVARKPDRNNYELPQLGLIAENDITKIELSSSHDKILFKKEGTDWKISPEKYLADSKKVKDMISAIAKLKLSDLISESKNYKRYDLDQTKGIEVKCWVKGKVQRQIILGKSAQTFNHTFVKLVDNDAIYSAIGDIRKYFDNEKDEYRDKLVLSFDQKTIHEIEIKTEENADKYTKTANDIVTESDKKSGSNTETMTAGARWVNSKGIEADNDQISSILSSLSSLKCEKYLKDKTDKDLLNQIYKIELKGAST
ncbi:MAG: DUF4340 domain-containing protein, partial [Deltaproteobacteria bacterium]|nr:DUF4340 domain-containing protein [Deltaproteobacteria bacterium]